MKSLLAYAAILSVFLIACNSGEQTQQLKALATKDSMLMIKAIQKDSTIDSYIRSMNAIQDNLDSIKAKERILTLKEEGAPTNKILTDIKSLDKLIVKDNREIYRLEKKLKTADKKDIELEKMVARLNKELSEKDAQIVELENKLAKANDSLKFVVHQLSDSILVINRQRAEITAMRGEINTVYYAIGTIKELKNKGVVSKEGGFIGIGRTAELKQDFNSSYFTKTNMIELNNLPLNAKFVKIVSNHPSDSYKISGNGKMDSLHILNPVAFWSESKYLVVVVK